MKGGRGTHLGLAIVALLAAQLLTASAAPAAARLRVAKPHGDQLITRQKVGVVLHTPAKLRTLDVTLGDRNVRSSFVRLRPGVWRGGFGPGKLVAGPNHLVASTLDRAGHQEYVSRRFVVGRKRPGFLRLRVRGRVASSAVAKVRMRSYPDLEFRARLNGRNVGRLFRRSFLRNRTARLGADDGLRFGRNVLRVTAARRNGVFDVERRVVFVRRDRPLVGAGPDSLSAGRRPVVLDGRKSLPSAISGGRLSHHWSVVSRPKGSRAKPAHPAAARTRFRPDRVGIYRIRLTVRDRSGRRGSDVATVSEIENAPPIGIPIETMAYNGARSEQGAEFGIRIGAETHPLGFTPSHNSIQAVILDRSTLQVLATPTYLGSAADAQSLKSTIEGYGSSALVIVSNPGVFANTEVNPAFKEVVEKLGASFVPKLSKSEETESGWSAIGVPGSGNGATQVAGTNPTEFPGNMRGYLSRDSSGLFTYIPASTVSFDSSAPGAPAGQNTIRVGDDSYPSGPLECPEAKGGFQIQILFSETLQPVTHPNPSLSFTTNGCGAGSDGTQVREMAEYLDLISPGNGVGGYKLVFVQSIGSPRDPETQAQWSTLAASLERIGGTGAVAGSATQGYALLGQVGVPDFPLTEASQSLTGAAAHITGVLEPDNLGSYVPVVSSPTATTPFDLAEIAYQPAQPWPDSETAGEKAALAYVAGLLDLPKPSLASSCYVPPKPDVRSEYCNEDVRGEWSGYVGQLRGARCEAKCQRENGFTATDWEDVKAELAGAGRPNEFFEFNAVQSTWELVRALQTPFGASGVNAQVSLNSLATQIKEALQPPASSESTGFWLNMISGLGYIASYFAGDDLEAFVGTLSGAIGLGAEFANGPEGSPLLGEFKVDAADVAEDLGQRYRTGSGGIATIGELVVTDYGKLKAVATDPNLAGFTSRSVAGMAERLETGSRQWIYETLFPAAYEAVNLVPGELNKSLPAEAGSFECLWVESGGFGPTEERYKPFSPAAEAQYRYDSPGPTLGALVERGAKLPEYAGHKETPRSPPSYLFEPIFKPVLNGGLGLYEPWFWRQAFGFPGPGVKNVKC